MISNNWENIKDLFSEALEYAPTERARFLEKACADEKTRDEILELLISFDEDEHFMESGAIVEVAQIIAGNRIKFKTGEKIGRYEIKAHLGSGGMGEVFLAEDTDLERLVALKILPTFFSKDADRVRRFIREAKSASALNHPNIITIYEIGRFDDSHYIATEYIKGETLRERQNRQPLDLYETLNVAEQVVSALDAAHEANILHRDVKPENIMLRDDRLVKVLDFGLAKLIADEGQTVDPAAPTYVTANATTPGMILGTIAYMSPEQARGKQIDQRTDVWSFGVCLYELLAGFQPFEGETSSDRIALILTGEPPPLGASIPAELQRIVKKALRKNREDRYQTAAALLADLKLFRDSTTAAGAVVIDTSFRNVRATAENKAVTGISGFLSSGFTNLKARPSRPLIASAIGALLVLFVFIVLRTPTVHQPPPEAQRWFASGTDALRRGNYYRASKLLEQAVQADDDFLLAHARLAEVWTELDYADRAAQSMLRVTESLPQLSNLSSDQELYLQAVTSTVRRNYQGALANYEKIAERAAEDEKSFAYFDVGRALEKLEASDRAIETYEEVIRRDPQYGAAYLRLAGLYWSRDGQEKGLEFFDKAAAIFTALGDYDSLGETNYQIGSWYVFFDNLPAGQKYQEKALELAKATDNRPREVKATLSLGRIAYGRGANDQAKQLTDGALRLAQAEQLENLTTEGLIDLGTVFYLKGEFTEAENYFKQALQIARVNGGKLAEARALSMLGNLFVSKIKPVEAVSYLEPALNFYRENNFHEEKLRVLLALGLAYDQTARHQVALESFNEVLAQADEKSDPGLVAQTEEAIGLTLIHTERFSESLVPFKNSFRINSSLGREQIGAYCALGESEALFQMGRFGDSERALQVADEVAVRSDDRQLSAQIKLLRAQISLSRNDYQRAIEQSQDAVRLSGGEANDILVVAARLHMLAESRRGSLAKASELLQKALADSAKVEIPRLLPGTRLAQAEILLNDGDAAGALDAALTASEAFSQHEARHSQWQALAIAADASSVLNNAAQAREYAERAKVVFDSLKQFWGRENYQSYQSRSDVRSRLLKLENLSKK